MRPRRCGDAHARRPRDHFHDQDQQVTHPLTCELRLTEGVFTVRAVAATLTVTAEASAEADLILTIDDEHLHQLLTHQITPADAVAKGVATVAGDTSALPDLIRLVAFPDLSSTT